jgi:hypothetical protein
VAKILVFLVRHLGRKEREPACPIASCPATIAMYYMYVWEIAATSEFTGEVANSKNKKFV